MKHNISKSGFVEQLEPEQEALITIKADEQIYHGHVITVMDELRTIDGVSLGIATVPKPVDAAKIPSIALS